MGASRQYSIILHPDPDEGGYTVTVPTLPGCATQDDTLQEAAMAREAIELHLEGLVERGLPLPLETDVPRVVLLDVQTPDAATA